MGRHGQRELATMLGDQCSLSPTRLGSRDRGGARPGSSMTTLQCQFESLPAHDSNSDPASRSITKSNESTSDNCATKSQTSSET